VISLYGLKFSVTLLTVVDMNELGRPKVPIWELAVMHTGRCTF